MGQRTATCKTNKLGIKKDVFYFNSRLIIKGIACGKVEIEKKKKKKEQKEKTLYLTTA